MAARWAIVAALGLVLSACATGVPLSLSRSDRWETDVEAYREQLDRFNAQARELLEDYEALRADPNFPPLETKIKDLAVRAASGDKATPDELTAADLYTMTLGELLLFPKFLDLSTRWVTLEATKSELERVRLELRARRIALDRQGPGSVGLVQTVSLSRDAPSVVQRPVTAPWSCAVYVVGRLAFAPLPPPARSINAGWYNHPCCTLFDWHQRRSDGRRLSVTGSGRKVRAPRGRVLGNAQGGRPHGQCHRK